VYLITSFSQSITAVRAGTNVLFIHFTLLSASSCYFVKIKLKERQRKGKEKVEENKLCYLFLFKR